MTDKTHTTTIAYAIATMGNAVWREKTRFYAHYVAKRPTRHLIHMIEDFEMGLLIRAAATHASNMHRP